MPGSYKIVRTLRHPTQLTTLRYSQSNFAHTLLITPRLKTCLPFLCEGIQKVTGSQDDSIVKGRDTSKSFADTFRSLVTLKSALSWSKDPVLRYFKRAHYR